MGTPDVVLYNILFSDQTKNVDSIQSEIQMEASNLKIGMGKLAKNKLISVDKKTKAIKLTEAAIAEYAQWSKDQAKDDLQLVKSNALKYTDTQLAEDQLE